MSITLFDLTYRVMRELGLTHDGTATGGAATTINDTVDRTEANDYWNGGTAWILYDAGGAGASPEGKYAKITDSTSAGALTIVTVTDAVAAGDRYSVSRNIVPLEIVIQKINQALFALGSVPLYSTATAIAANQTEYSLPAAVRDIRRVSYQTVDDSNDNRWVELQGWFIQPNNTSGGADVLILPEQLSASFDMKIDYMAPHPSLNIYSDILYDAVPPELVVYPAVVECLRFRRQRSGWQREFEADLQRYDDLAEKMRQSRSLRNIIKKPGRLVKHTGYDITIDDSEPNKVYLR